MPLENTFLEYRILILDFICIELKRIGQNCLKSRFEIFPHRILVESVDYQAFHPHIACRLTTATDVIDNNVRLFLASSKFAMFP